MSLLDKIKATRKRLQQTASERRVRKSAARNRRQRARERKKQRARQAAQEVGGLGRDAAAVAATVPGGQTAARAAKRGGRAVREAIREAGEVPEIERDQTADEVKRRAEDLATAGPVITDASLNPAPSHELVADMARGGGEATMADEREAAAEANARMEALVGGLGAPAAEADDGDGFGAYMEGLVMGDGEAADADGEDGGALDFADPLGLMGGGER